jgi:pyrroloquinoline-quinone synthase
METLTETLPLQTILDASRFPELPFFRCLANGEMDRAAFMVTQQQFYHAVINFGRPLAMIAAAIPSYEERAGIIENLWEEHGKGDLTKTHGYSFREFLRRINHGREVELVSPGVAVISFNCFLMQVCQEEDYLRGVAALGMVERLFADISCFIGTSVVHRGWIAKEELIHYNLHQELDHLHAEDFFKILRNYSEDPKRSTAIVSGLEAGAASFLQLYHDLYPEKYD